MTNSEKLTDKEIDARREAGLKKLLSTPPKPNKPKEKGSDDVSVKDRKPKRPA